MTTVANMIICSSTIKCTTAGACCGKVNAVTGVANTGANISDTICIPAGSAITASLAVTVQSGSPGITATMLTSGNGFPAVACPAYVAGASTLAVTAVAAATAVYMM